MPLSQRSSIRATGLVAGTDETRTSMMICSDRPLANATSLARSRSARPGRQKRSDFARLRTSVSKPSPAEVARTEFHSLELLSTDAGIEYARRIGVSFGPQCPLSSLARQNLTERFFVPSKMRLWWLMTVTTFGARRMRRVPKNECRPATAGALAQVAAPGKLPRLTVMGQFERQGGSHARGGPYLQHGSAAVISQLVPTITEG